MRRKIAVAIGAACVIIMTAGPASADRGAPGTTFPEQPGSKLISGCEAVLSAPNSSENHSTVAAAITGGLVADACFGG